MPISSRCDSEYVSSSGEIRTPNYPEHYHTNSQWCVILHGDVGRLITG